MKKFFKNKKILKEKKGFTLIFAILVSVMVLAVGASIINISLKQVVLSSSGRESQFAFYAANTGLECALYWDLNGLVVDGTGLPEYVFPPAGGTRRDDTENFTCAGTNIAEGDSTQPYTQDEWVLTEVGSSVSTTVFRLAISNNIPSVDNVSYCAEVTVKKTTDGEGSITTNIISQGLNTCDPEGDARAVQRGLELEYRS